MKEDFFSKFKDYNRELEKILEHKVFSEDVKNLLLSMFYKVDISYNDYSVVKRNTKTKTEYLENILDNIKITKDILLIKPNDSRFEEIKEKGAFEIDFKTKKITVLANEISLLLALLELNNFEIHLKEEYNLTRNSMPYLLNMAYDMENVEVLRDFNAWSWNTLVNEIKDININLIYQIFKITINQDIFEVLQKSDKYVDVMEYITKELFKLYPKEYAEKFLNLILKISILIYINKSENEKKRLREEKDTLELDLKEIKDKKVYIENITKEKKKMTNQVKNIDLIINDKDLLLEEYLKRNEKLSEYNKLFSLSHLVERLQKERDKFLEKIEVCNQKMQPQKYLEDKSKLQKDYNLLKSIKFEGKNDIHQYIDKVQEIFLQNLFISKIKNSFTRNELINCIYELRYYNFLPYNKEKLIKDIKKIDEHINNIKELLIEKLYNTKIINTISTNVKNDIEIVKNIFDLKIIDLEDIYLEIRKKDKDYIIKFYDEKETLETQIVMQLEFNKKDKIKLNRKIKLFV